MKHFLISKFWSPFQKLFRRQEKFQLRQSVTTKTTIYFLSFTGIFFFRFGVEKNWNPRWKKSFDRIISQWDCWMQPIKKQSKCCQKLLWKIKMSSSNQLTLYVFNDGKLLNNNFLIITNNLLPGPIQVQSNNDETQNSNNETMNQISNFGRSKGLSWQN